MLPPQTNFYRAFTDPSGGSDDSFALAISHKANDWIIIDAIREARRHSCPVPRWHAPGPAPAPRRMATSDLVGDATTSGRSF
jgi:hypothetical protein